MKKLLALLALLGFLLLSFFGWKWYKHNVLCCCGPNAKQEKTVTKEETKVQIPNEPLVYGWDKSDAIIGDAWNAKKAEIVGQMTDGKMLRIVGPYYNEEVNNTTYENLGLARADAVKKMLSDQIDSAKMEIGSKLVDYYDGAKNNYLVLDQMDWNVRNENIQEIDGKALIYFPTGSAKKIVNQNIINYLKSVAQAMEGNDKTVTITGHTDNTGNPDSNYQLGLRRANSVKNTLIGYGVASERITAQSKGITEPIATNDTAEGRQKNRRVELQLN